MKKLVNIIISTVFSAIYGYISVYWILVSYYMASNSWAEQGSYSYEEKTFLMPWGYIGFILYVILFLYLLYKWWKKDKSNKVVLGVVFLLSLVITYMQL